MSFPKKYLLDYKFYEAISPKVLRDYRDEPPFEEEKKPLDKEAILKQFYDRYNSLKNFAIVEYDDNMKPVLHGQKMDTPLVYKDRLNRFYYHPPINSKDYLDFLNQRDKKLEVQQLDTTANKQITVKTEVQKAQTNYVLITAIIFIIINIFLLILLFKKK